MKLVPLLWVIPFLNFSDKEQSPVQLTGKVFDIGSQTHFGNLKKCEFYFECDCCSGKLIFADSSNFLMIYSCMSDLSITTGKYWMTKDSVLLNSGKARKNIRYNWKHNKNSATEPKFFVTDTLITPYDMHYTIDYCKGIMLIEEDEDETSIAIETDEEIGDVFDEFQEYNLEEHIISKL